MKGKAITFVQLAILVVIIVSVAFATAWVVVGSFMLSPLTEETKELRSRLDYATTTLTNQSKTLEIMIEGQKLGTKILDKAIKFSNKMSEGSSRINEYDTVTARKKISEAKLMLPDLAIDMEEACSFIRTNVNIFGSEYLSYINCEGNKEMFKSCYPQMLDALFNMVSVLENAKKLEEGKITLEEYKSLCNSFLNNYNPIRSTCNTLSEKYDLGLYFPDSSGMCKI
jgi:hypothetical protein